MSVGLGCLDLSHAPTDGSADPGTDQAHDENACGPREPFGHGAGPWEGHDGCVAGDGGDQEHQREGVVSGMKQAGKGEPVEETEYGTNLGVANY